MVKARRKEPSKSKFFFGLAAIAVAGAAVIGYASMQSKPDARTVDPNAPKATAQGIVLGDTSAPVEIVEFADFECPACGQFATVTEPDVRKRLVETGRARFVFYYFPLPMHRNAWPASHAAACANEQGKFWPMHDRIFLGQLEWNGEATRNPKSVFEKYAQETGLDAAAWESCYDTEKYRAQIQAHYDEAVRRQVQSTPTFVIGKRMLPGSLSYDQIKVLVDSAAVEAAAGRRPGTTDSARSPATR